MTTQLLIYETAVPVSSGRHGKASVEVGEQYGFARHLNSIPLMAVEFPMAAADYAIVFAVNGDGIVPVVILGARQSENLYLTDDNKWRAKPYCSPTSTEALPCRPLDTGTAVS